MRRVLVLLAFAATAAAGNPLAGPQACQPCHATEYRAQSNSRHFHALRPIRQSPLWDLLTPMGSLSCRPEGDDIVVSAKGGADPVSATLQWAFGAGAQGITPVGLMRGQFIEHRFSYYPGARKFALTFGHPLQAGGGAPSLGLLQDSAAITQCFTCHATGVAAGANGPDLSNMLPGISCERCHGPGAAHAAAARDGKALTASAALLNPGRLSPRAQAQVCGECHRVAPPGNLNPEPEIEDPVSVRFAPIGLMASRCFLQSKTLTCTTCHDVHQNARPRSDPFYVQRCVGCHANAPAAKSHCRRAARENCLNCHMRQASLTPYLKFTDHRIRVN